MRFTCLVWFVSSVTGVEQTCNFLFAVLLAEMAKAVLRPVRRRGVDLLRGRKRKCFFLFKRVVARRAVYHTLNVITISLYVCPSVCVERVLGGGGWTRF